MLARALVVFTALVLIGPFQSVIALAPQQARELPPLSYVCPMVGDEEVLKDKPGQCPKCKMTLVPVRFDLSWTCPNHPVIVTTQSGKCPLDKRDLVQVTVALYWTCRDEPNQRLTEPGRCADGTSRQEQRQLRAHGDHNPRHGGQFFMAQDNWHHLEGAYPREGLFRIFTYDNFTKPIDAAKFTGRAVTREERDPVSGAYKEIEFFPLRPARDGKALTAQVKNAKLPLKITAKIRFDEKLPEQRFDFTFTEYSKEPSAVPSAAATTTASAADTSPSYVPTTRQPNARTSNTSPAQREAPSVLQIATAPQTVPSPTTAAATNAPAVASSAFRAPAANAPTAAVPARVLSDCSPAVSRTEAALFSEDLPQTSRELLRLISMCDESARTLISDGQFGTVYLPAMLGKDIAIALEDHLAELSEQRKAQAEDAVWRLVLAAWQLDQYGDLGNLEKLRTTYDLFAAAVADITAAYAP